LQFEFKDFVMTFNLVNRRVHLYLGLFLMVSFIRMGVTAIFFAHPFNFKQVYKDTPAWVVRSEEPYKLAISDETNLRQLAAEVIKDAGVEEGPFRVSRQGKGKQRLDIVVGDFWSTTRLTYFINKQQLRIEDKPFRWDHFFHKFHLLHGYGQKSFFSDLWAFLLDLLCVSIIFWCVSGIYMWWKLGPARLWGSVALAGGVASFAIFLMVL